jgi:hypothetical protein
MEACRAEDREVMTWTDFGRASRALADGLTPGSP